MANGNGKNGTGVALGVSVTLIIGLGSLAFRGQDRQIDNQRQDIAAVKIDVKELCGELRSCQLEYAELKGLLKLSLKAQGVGQADIDSTLASAADNTNGAKREIVRTEDIQPTPRGF